MQNVLIVCLGNICRSPMGEGLLKHKLAQSYPHVKVSSAGITALVGKPADALAQQIMLEKNGIDISQHRAQQLTQELLLQMDLILVMDQAQQKEIEFKFPSICGRVHRLGKWGGFDIIDPYKRPIQIFDQVFTLIDESVNEWQKRLWNKRN